MKKRKSKPWSLESKEYKVGLLDLVNKRGKHIASF